MDEGENKEANKRLKIATEATYYGILLQVKKFD